MSSVAVSVISRSSFRKIAPSPIIPHARLPAVALRDGGKLALEVRDQRELIGEIDLQADLRLHEIIGRARARYGEVLSRQRDQPFVN